MSVLRATHPQRWPRLWLMREERARQRSLSGWTWYASRLWRRVGGEPTMEGVRRLLRTVGVAGELPNGTVEHGGIETDVARSPLRWASRRSAIRGPDRPNHVGDPDTRHQSEVLPRAHPLSGTSAFEGTGVPGAGPVWQTAD